MNIQEAIKQHKKAIEENSRAQAGAREAAEKARAAWNNCKSIEVLKDDTNPLYIAAMQASQEERTAKEAAQITNATRNAAADNVLNVVANVLRAAILESPAKFKNPCHFKAFIKAVEDITGPEFYLDNSYNYSLYICYRGADHGQHSIFLCEKEAGALKITDKLKERNQEFTLKEIKQEAKKAKKDAEKIRAAYEKAEKAAKDIRAKYKTSICYMLPDIYAGSLHDKKLF